MNQDAPIIDNHLLRNRSRSYDHRNTRNQSNTSRQISNKKEDPSEDITNFSKPGPLDSINDKDSNRDQDVERDEKQPDPIDNPYMKYANYTSLMLENKGSVARDHLSNERTFLAWTRTALAFILVGVGFTQFYRLEVRSAAAVADDIRFDIPEDRIHETFKQLGKPLGTLSFVLAAITLLFGVYRYYQVQMMLTREFYPATRITVIVLLIINLVILILLLILNIKVLMNHITSLSTCGHTVIEVNRYRLRLLKRQIKRGLNDQTNNKTIEIKYIGAGNVA